MYYWPTLADLYGTLPSDEQSELMALVVLGPEYVHPPAPVNRIRYEQLGVEDDPA